MLRHGFVSAALRVVAGLVLCASAWSATPLLLRNPSLGRDRIAFLYADDIWTVAREGGEAKRLTSAGNVFAGPYFSPDHTLIAYSTRSHGLMDVYVVDADGGLAAVEGVSPAPARFSESVGVVLPDRAENGALRRRIEVADNQHRSARLQ